MADSRPMESNTISLDLRIRILDACDRHDGTQRQIAERFKVSFAFVKKLLRQRKQLGIIDNLYFRVGRKRLISEEQQERMRTYIKAHPGATLAEIAAACHLDCTIATVDNTLRRMGLTYKKRHFGLPNRTGKMLPPDVGSGKSGRRNGTRRSLSSSTNPASRRR